MLYWLISSRLAAFVLVGGQLSVRIPIGDYREQLSKTRRKNVKYSITYKQHRGKGRTVELNNQVAVFAKTENGIQRLKVKVSQDVSNRNHW